jgi:hypothetical protein
MFSKIALRASIASLTVILVASNATAHHSFSPHFDTSRKVSISGTIKAYEARNPHSYLHITAFCRAPELRVKGKIKPGRYK